jgi:asparagine synthetase B (glutamine-hydrolysing)
MCGIGGIINANLERDELERRLLRMQSALHHRGPDDEELLHADYVLCPLEFVRQSVAMQAKGSTGVHSIPFGDRCRILEGQSSPERAFCFCT